MARYGDADFRIGDQDKVNDVEGDLYLPFSMDALLAVGFNQLPKYIRTVALGNNPNVGTGTVPQDVWSGGGLYPWMTGSTALEIVSSSAADAAAGTGARTVLVNGLDADYEPVAQTVTLNGTTAAPLATNVFRINSAVIMTSGSGQVNAGTLTIRDAGGGTTRAIIPLGYGITKQAQYTVRAGHTLQIISSFFNVQRQGAEPGATLSTWARGSNGTYRMALEFTVSGNPYRHDGIPGIVVPEKSDFGFRCNAVKSNNTDITAAWLGVLRINDAA